MIFRIFLTIFFLFILSYLNSSAQPGTYYFDHIKVEDGLSQSSVNDILIDDYGFIWFCTEHGLNRYDGKQFKVFTADDDDENRLSNYRVFCGITDHAGYLWFGTEIGLNRYELKTSRIDKFFHNPNDENTLSNNNVRSLHYDIEKNIWIGTSDGLNKFIRSESRFERYYLHDTNNEAVRIRCITEDTYNHSLLWLGTEGNGLIRFNKVSGDYKYFKFISKDLNYDTNIVNVIKEKDDKILYIGTHDGFIIFDKVKESAAEYHSFQIEDYSFSNDRISDIEFMPNGNIWIGTWNDGLIITDDKLQNPLNIRHSPNYSKSLSNNRVLNICKTDNIVWLGTYSGGINKFDFSQRKFTVTRSKPDDKNSLISNEIWGFFEDSRDNFWICTDSGLELFNRDKNTYRHFTTNNSGLSADDVFVMVETPDGYLWIGTRNGLNKMSPDKRIIKHYKAEGNSGIADNIVITLFVDKEGTLFLGTFSGMNKYIASEDRFEIFRPSADDENTISNELVFCFEEDSKNNIWIGTNNGLNKYSKETGKFEKFFYDPDNSNSLSNNRVYSLYFDADGILWIATLGGGFNRFDPIKNEYTRYRESDGLANDVVYGVIQDDDLNFWITTNNGISKFNPKTQSFNNYNTDDGLQSNEFNYGSYYKSKDGQIYLGGVNGFNSFYPNDIKFNSAPPKTVITGVKVLNRDITPQNSTKLSTDIMFAESFELEYDENVFAIEFASLNFSSPEKNQYSYKIDGINDDWILNGNRNSVTFANLPAGNYTFRVRSSNNDNLWNMEGTSLRLIVNPPYWATWWAYGIYILLGILLIWLIIWYRNRMLKREIEVLQQADRLKSEFLAQMSHEIRSPINVILSFSSLLKSEVEQYLDDDLKDGFTSIHNAGERIIRTIDMILNMSEIQTGIYDFRPQQIEIYEDIFVKLYLEYNQRAKEKKLDFYIEYDSNVRNITGDIYTVTQIFANLIDNAIKYTDRGSIKVSINSIGNSVEVNVADTGRGILAEYIPNLYKTFSQEQQGYTRQFEGNGLGLALVKKYCELNNAEIDVKSKKGVGSTFKVTFNQIDDLID